MVRIGRAAIFSFSVRLRSLPSVSTLYDLRRTCDCSGQLHCSKVPSDMPLRPSLPWLLTTLAAALVAMTVAAGAIRKAESATAAAIFAIVLVATAVRTNSPLWRRSAGTADARRDAARCIAPNSAAYHARLLVVCAGFLRDLHRNSRPLAARMGVRLGLDADRARPRLLFVAYRRPQGQIRDAAGHRARRAPGISAGRRDRMRTDMADRIGQAIFVERRLGCEPTVSRRRVRNHVPEHDHDKKLRCSDGAAGRTEEPISADSVGNRSSHVRREACGVFLHHIRA